MKTIVLWICGMLASGIFGGLIGNTLDYSTGGPFGFLGGVFAFICVRLWITTAASRSS